uniref:Carbonic anhydrase n=1 Tax=Sphenodon punctatus TaxID=8508 RepID=A0A8D0HBY3_SPHPU
MSSQLHPPWGYSKDIGPDTWHKNYPFAKGDNQSPVELNTDAIHQDPILLPWFTSYDPGASKTLLNNGKTCKVVFDDTFDRSVLRGGPLPGIYRLRQLHFHWGSTDNQGSEHIVDGARYAAELHLVHWYSKYSNYAEALRQNDGVTVVAVFLEVNTKGLFSIFSQGKEIPFQKFDPSILFPKSRGYWTYYGSFTTPPFEECVTWILLREPIIVSADQMTKLRSLSCKAANEPHCPLVDNCRPPQPLNYRMVRASIQ